MIARVFALVRGKGTQCPLLNRSIQASSALRRNSHLRQHFSCLHRWSSPSDHLSQEQQPPQNNSRGAPPARTFESSWTMQNKLSPKENPADSSPISTKDTVGGSFDQRFAMLRSIGEYINEDDIRLLLRKKNVPTCYVWCDPSPTMHINQGITMTINVNKMVKAGCKVKILMTDWFAHMNHGIGNLRKIQDICSDNIEMWKATGMYLDGVEFVHLSDEISCHADQYWPLAMDIARKTEPNEIKKYLNLSKDRRLYGSLDPYVLRELSSAEIVFTCLQSAAILSHKVDMWLLNIGQRAGNMVATRYRECTPSKNLPIALFNNVLPSLLEHPEMEMCGDPRWAIFMEDTEIAVGRAIRKAFCPPRVAESNPCLEYIKHIIFPLFGKFEVVRKEENGGNKTFLSMAHLTGDYENGTLQPADVKQALEKAINMTLQPIRDHFANNSDAKKLLEAIQVN